MKALITLFFNLHEYQSDKQRLVIWINDKKHEFDKLSSQIPIWDIHPILNTCRIHLVLYDITNEKTGILGGRKKLEDLPVIQEYRYKFQRFLNERTRVYPKLSFGNYLMHHSTECSLSGFDIPKSNPILGESSLKLVVSSLVTDPIDLCLYFENWNISMIKQAQSQGKKTVELLRVSNIVSANNGIILIYYQTYLNQTEKYPLLINEEDRVEYESTQLMEKPVVVEESSENVDDLISFD